MQPTPITRVHASKIRAGLVRICIGPGRTFSFRDVSMEDKLEIGLGMKRVS